MNAPSLPILDLSRPYLVEKRNIILMPDTDDYREWVPDDATFVTLKGEAFWACANTPALNNLLYSIGEQVPSPIYFSDYDWSGVKIFAAQAQMAGLLTARRRAYNLSDMGTGKTIGTLLAIDWLMQEKHIQRALVVAPLSILWLVWQREIMKGFPRLRPVVLHGTSDKRLKLMRQSGWNVAIINHDGIGVIHDELLHCNFGCVIVDEAASFNDTRTRKFKLMQALVKNAPFAGGLTGSPTPNAPSDAYGLAKLFTPERITMGFRAFRQTVEVEVRPHRWVAKQNAAEKVHRLLQPAVRFRRSDVIELKAMGTQTQHVAMSSKQERAFTELRKEAVIRFPEGLVEGVNAAVMVNKLLQICAGAVYTSERETIDLEAVNRYEILKTIIDGADSKVIVLAPYLHVVELLHSNLKDYNHAVVTGDVKSKDRTEIFCSFADKYDPLRVLIAHPEVLAHGLNLTSANIIVWFAPIRSRRIYEQANARITRLGQEREQLIVHLSCGKIEDAAYADLERKGTMQDIILALFENN